MSNHPNDNESTLRVVDAVFVIGTGSKNNNEELKYALRNIDKRCSFIRNVYISGECPSWVDKNVVIHLPWPDRFHHAKDANIIDKLRHACEQPGISKDILFCSDDQFVTKDSKWEDFSPRWLRKYEPNDKWYADRRRIWHDRLKKTLELDRQRRLKQSLDTSTIYYYQPHMWMQIDRDKFIEYAKWCDYEHSETTIIASGYFNYINAGGKSNFDHTFITPSQQWPVESRHIAYTDSSFSAAMKYLKADTPNPSRFERASTADTADTAVKARRSDEEIIQDVRTRIKRQVAWSSLWSEVDAAEGLRLQNAKGWKTVWNDIIRRWAADTQRGSLTNPVTTPRSANAEQVLKENKKNIETTTKTANAEAPKKKGCSRCEERRRRAREEQEKRDRQAREQELQKAAQPVVRPKEPEPYAAERQLAKTVVIPGRNGRELSALDTTNAENSKQRQAIDDIMAVKSAIGDMSKWACEDCAKGHIAAAIAHLNANNGNPDAIDIELAKGEVRVACQHLVALQRFQEYNMLEISLRSIETSESMFTSSYLRSVLAILLKTKSP